METEWISTYEPSNQARGAHSDASETITEIVNVALKRYNRITCVHIFWNVFIGMPRLDSNTTVYFQQLTAQIQLITQLHANNMIMCQTNGEINIRVESMDRSRVLPKPVDKNVDIHILDNSFGYKKRHTVHVWLYFSDGKTIILMRNGIDHSGSYWIHCLLSKSKSR